MNVIEMWQSVNNVFNFINEYNYAYMKQKTLQVFPLIQYIRDIYENGMSDILYWENTKVDLLKIIERGDALQKAETAADDVSIYDILNGDLWKEIKLVAETLFDQDVMKLRDYFWRTNKEALEVYYPQIAECIEAIQLEEKQLYYRPYGIRGRVVYRIEENSESDLYSGYNPIGLGMQIAEGFKLEKYCKIFVWGYNAGFEVNGIMQPKEGKIDIEIYVANLAEFKQILINTPRRGALLHPNIKYKFNMNPENLIERFDLQRKSESYIYVCPNNSEDLTVLRKFINNNSIHSNIEVLE